MRRLPKCLILFGRYESGVVTTDFVVITAAIVGLGIAVGVTVGSGGVGLAEDTADIVDTQTTGAHGGSAAATGTEKDDRASKKADRKKRREERKKRRAERKAKRQAKKN